MKRLCFCVWTTVGMIAVFFNGSVVTAFPPFKKSFQEKYVTEGPANLKTAFKEVKCNVCHQGKKKKPRNPYGIELSKHLDHDVIKEWRSTKDKDLKKELKQKILDGLAKAYEKVEEVESPSGEGTYGERIKKGLLPVVLPAK